MNLQPVLSLCSECDELYEAQNSVSRLAHMESERHLSRALERTPLDILLRYTDGDGPKRALIRKYEERLRAKTARGVLVAKTSTAPALKG